MTESEKMVLESSSINALIKGWQNEHAGDGIIKRIVGNIRKWKSFW